MTMRSAGPISITSIGAAPRPRAATSLDRFSAGLPTTYSILSPCSSSGWPTCLCTASFQLPPQVPTRRVTPLHLPCAGDPAGSAAAARAISRARTSGMPNRFRVIAFSRGGRSAAESRVEPDQSLDQRQRDHRYRHDERRDGEDARVKVELQDLEDLDGQRHV